MLSLHKLLGYWTKNSCESIATAKAFIICTAIVQYQVLKWMFLRNILRCTAVRRIRIITISGSRIRIITKSGSRIRMKTVEAATLMYTVQYWTSGCALLFVFIWNTRETYPAVSHTPYTPTVPYIVSASHISDSELYSVGITVAYSPLECHIQCLLATYWYFICIAI